METLDSHFDHIEIRLQLFISMLNINSSWSTLDTNTSYAYS